MEHSDPRILVILAHFRHFSHFFREAAGIKSVPEYKAFSALDKPHLTIIVSPGFCLSCHTLSFDGIIAKQVLNFAI